VDGTTPAPPDISACRSDDDRSADRGHLAHSGGSPLVGDEDDDEGIEPARAGDLRRDGSLVQTLSDASYGFDDPRGIAFDGDHIWVTNYGGNSVTELNASDGSLVRTLSAGYYGFSGPIGVAFDGSHIWVTNYSGSTVTEVNAGDGSPVKTFSDDHYGIVNPVGVVFDGSHIWVANYGQSSLTEFPDY
jgi:hypothetical protein